MLNPSYFKTGLEAGDGKAKRPLTRTKASSSLQPVKELAEKCPVQKPTASKSPEPMDMEEIVDALEECFGKNVVDIDAGDHDNPQLCSEYVNEIYRYMRELEVMLMFNILNWKVVWFVKSIAHWN